MLPDTGPLILVISKEEVLALDLAPALGVLATFFENSRHPSEVAGNVQVVFHGWHDDSRELCEIPSVRRYVENLDKNFPYWFYVSDLTSETLAVVALCLCKSSSVQPGLAAFDQSDFKVFLEDHFQAMNSILSRYGVDEAYNVRLTEAVMEYFEGRRVWN